MSEAPEAELLREVTQRLAEAGLRPRLEPRTERFSDISADTLLRLHIADKDVVTPVQVKRSMTSATVGAIRSQLARDAQKGALLVTEHVSTAVAERLRGLDLHFADAVGNMYFSFPGVLIWVVGRRPAGSPQKERRSHRAFQAKGLRVVFALLAKPDLASQTYRAIADTTAVALGTVQAVVKDLEGSGYLTAADGSRRLRNQGQLLDRWAEFYAAVLRPRLAMGRFRSADAAWWRTARPQNYGALWGGETAGALLTDHLRPEITTVYTRELPKELVIEQRLSRDDSGDVEIRRHFWSRDLPSPRRDVVPAPLVYADLLAVGDSRSAETAEMVRERYLP